MSYFLLAYSNSHELILLIKGETMSTNAQNLNPFRPQGSVLVYAGEGMGDLFQALTFVEKNPFRKQTVSQYLSELVKGSTPTVTNKKVLRLLEEAPESALKNMEPLRRPPYLVGGMAGYVTLLNEHYTDMHRQLDRYLKPVTDWFANAMAHSGEAKLMPYPKIERPEMDAYKEAFQALFDTDDNPNRDNGLTTDFLKLYPLKKQFVATGEQLHLLDDKIQEFDHRRFEKMEARLLELVIAYQDNSEEIEIDRKDKAQLAEDLYQMGECMEYFAAIVYEATRAGNLFTDHQGLLEKEL